MTDKRTELARPFPPRYIHKNPSGGGTYVKHHVVNQRLIEVLGTPPDFKMVEVIRGDVAGYTSEKGVVYSDLTNVVVGVVAQLRADLARGKQAIEVTIEEAGDCEQPHNWKTDGQRLKDAMSDAYKRCAMRLGCGLHLWSGDEYFLYQHLAERSGSAESTQVEPQEGADASHSGDSQTAPSSPHVVEDPLL